MSNLSGAVARTMNFVFSDLDGTAEEKKKRIQSLKNNIGKVANISISEITTNENIRRSIDVKSDNFLRLVESIKKYGVLENVIAELRINSNENDYKLVCVAGHRRILAAMACETITKIPCLLQFYDESSDRVGAALAENLNREDLHCLDVADGYKALVASGWQEDDIASHFCRDIRTVRHYLKMGGWSEDIKDNFRKLPEIFSTRVIMREFAYKKFTTNTDLKRGIKNYLTNKKTKNNQPKVVEEKSKSKDLDDKNSVKMALKEYLSQQKVLSKLIKDEITRAFVELKLI